MPAKIVQLTTMVACIPNMDLISLDNDFGHAKEEGYKKLFLVHVYGSPKPLVTQYQLVVEEVQEIVVEHKLITNEKYLERTC